MSLALISCGGGGGDTGQAGGTPASGGDATIALSTSDNSYANFKGISLTPQNLPVFGDARAYGRFSGNSQPDLFIATLNYSPSASTPQTAAPSTFAIYRKQPDGTYAIRDGLLQTNTGCIHPRKAVVADFNKDGKQDIFVACHGYDASPFPGERNKVILSQPDGTYAVRDASTDVGFFHSAAAADLNGDGYPDVVLVNNFDPKAALVLINDKTGTFTREAAGRLPARLARKSYFTVELADANGDGALDLLVGGHEWEGATTSIYLNPGNNAFDRATAIDIPPVPNEGVVLDFAVTGSGTDRDLWVLRTSGGDGTFYQSRVLQRVNLTTLASGVVVNQRPAEWVRWLIPATVSGRNVITTDRAADAFSFAY
jgi:hypothetical protein